MSHEQQRGGIPGARENVRSSRNELTSGLILSESFRALGANLGPFVSIMLLCLVPAYSLVLFGLYTDSLALLVGGQLLAFLMTIPAQGAMVYGTVQYMAGRQVSLEDNIQRGFASMWSVLGVGIAVVFVVALGLICFIIPGIVLLMVYYVAMPVAVVEDTNVGESMSRSAELTQGVRWTIFGAVFVVLLIQGAMNAVLKQIGMKALGFGKNSWELLMMTSITDIIIGALGAVMCAVVYVHLRHKSDDIDAEALSDVFA